jgi:hypothetical protein
VNRWKGNGRGECRLPIWNGSVASESGSPMSVVTNVKDGALGLSMSFFHNEEDIERTVGAIVTETGGKSAAAA